MTGLKKTPNLTIMRFNLRPFDFFLLVLMWGLLSTPQVTQAQFYENFEGEPTTEWRTRTGDGDTQSSIAFRGGYGRITVDARQDRRNVWWAIMETTVSDDLDLERLAGDGYELRVEARIRSNSAPKRVNLHLNTQRTTDFHSHLMEFDIPDTDHWHTISMTTRGFDGRPGDTVNGHLALMDWGRDQFWVDVDYYRVDVVAADEAGPDKGEQVVYPPPKPEPDQFSVVLSPAEAGMIDREYEDVNLSGWRDGEKPVLTTDATKTILLRWDLEEFRGMKADDYGMLELHPYSYYQAFDTGLHAFDHVRLVEILGGKQNWIREEVTWQQFTGGAEPDELYNTQMIVDIDMPKQNGSLIRLHIPRPVIQRMLDGTTKGIAIYPLGAMQASFHLGAAQTDQAPQLYFNPVE